MSEAAQQENTSMEQVIASLPETNEDIQYQNDNFNKNSSKYSNNDNENNNNNDNNYVNNTNRNVSQDDIKTNDKIKKVNTNNDSNIDDIANKLQDHNIAVKTEIRNTGIDPATQGEVQVRGNVSKQMKNFDPYKASKFDSFESLQILGKPLLDACARQKFVSPSKIQAVALPLILTPDENNIYPNIIAQAHHGSGKTATFVLSMLSRIKTSDHLLQCLCVNHSRELAIQTYNVTVELGCFMDNLTTVLCVPREILPKPWKGQIAIGTPGVILKIFNDYQSDMKKLLKSFQMIVIDEADEFLRESKEDNRGTRGIASQRGRGGKQMSINERYGSLNDQLNEIVNILQNSCVGKGKIQCLLFSATFPSHVKNLALTIAPNPIVITVQKQHLALKNILNIRIVCKDENEKYETLSNVLQACQNIGQIIIFVNRVDSAKDLLSNLKQHFECSALYGSNMDPSMRDKIVHNFRSGQTRCLIASNVIARGLDVPAVKLVINYEIPICKGNNGDYNLTFDSETFMHRIGRTGRFGQRGCCINLVMNNDKSTNYLQSICKEYTLEMQDVTNDTEDIEKTVYQWVGDDLAVVNNKSTNKPNNKPKIIEL